MKQLLISTVFLVLFSSARSSESRLACSAPNASGVSLKSPCDECSKALADQARKEFTAAFTYLTIGASFQKESNYRPGVAKFFLESANEERQHGKAIIKYALMRGLNSGLINDDLAKRMTPNITMAEIYATDFTVLKALEKALVLEKFVTDSISEIVGICDNCVTKEYHVSDYLTGDFLTEQMEGMRKIGEYINTLEHMTGSVGILKELMFDRTLLAE